MRESNSISDPEAEVDLIALEVEFKLVFSGWPPLQSHYLEGEEKAAELDVCKGVQLLSPDVDMLTPVDTPFFLKSTSNVQI